MATISSYAFSSIARPYALAAFQYAHEKNELAHWQSFLDMAAYVVNLPDVNPLITQSQLTSAQLLELFKAALSPWLDKNCQNFLCLLIENKRLILLPTIAELFQDYDAALLKTREVRVITAVPVNEDFRQQLKQALIKRLQQKVTLHCEIDPTIIAGAVIHVGDKVIDGSIRGKLTRLLEFSLR